VAKEPLRVVAELVNMESAERETRVMNALVDNPTNPIETVLRQNGMKMDDLKAAVKSGAFTDDIFDASMRMIVAPLLPKVLYTLARGAADGSDQKLHLLMQLLNKLQPDQTVNFNFENFSDQELASRLELLRKEFGGPPQIDQGA